MTRTHASNSFVWFAVTLAAAWSCGAADKSPTGSGEPIAIAGSYQLFNVNQNLLPYDLGTQSVDPSGGHCDLIADGGTLAITDRGGGSGDFKIVVNMHAACGTPGEPLHPGSAVQATQQGSMSVSNGQYSLSGTTGSGVEVTSMTPGNQGGVHVGTSLSSFHLGQYTMVFTK